MPIKPVRSVVSSYQADSRMECCVLRRKTENFRPSPLAIAANVDMTDHSALPAAGSRPELGGRLSGSDTTDPTDPSRRLSNKLTVRTASMS